ncbi:hypothetical protein LCGC14_2693430, partial [marine sediment metagenome]
TKGAEIMQAIESANVSCVKTVRGKGMMIGIEVDAKAADLFQACMAAGLLICYAKTNVLRLAPPLTTPDEDLEKGLGILLDVLKS